MMKKIILITFIAIVQNIQPSTTSKTITQNIKSSISTKFIKPITTNIGSQPVVRKILNFYTDPKYDKAHNFIYGLKSPMYNEEYYRPTFNWIQDYWKKNISDYFTYYHHNKIDPLIKNLSNTDQEKHAKKITDYYQAYNQYQKASHIFEKIKAEKNLLEKSANLQKALEHSIPQNDVHLE